MKRCTFTIEEIKFRSRPDTVNDCWIWTGARDKEGYGRWDAGQRLLGTRIAHRVAFYIVNGYAPEWPMVLDHKCNNKLCVNPDHLQVLHHLKNAFKDAPISPDTCPRGHNHWRYRKDGRECLDCRKLFKRKYRARKKAGLVVPRKQR